MTAPVRVGDVLRLAEADYKFGTGPLVLRVTKVLGTNLGPEWVELRGVEVATGGQDLGARVAAVRVGALKDPKTRKPH